MVGTSWNIITPFRVAYDCKSKFFYRHTHLLLLKGFNSQYCLLKMLEIVSSTDYFLWDHMTFQYSTRLNVNFIIRQQATLFINIITANIERQDMGISRMFINYLREFGNKIFKKFKSCKDLVLECA